MRLYNDDLLHSASDLNTFLGCRHAAALNLKKLRDPGSLPARALDDEAAVLIQDAGHAHEGRYLAQLREETSVVEIASTGSLEERAAATRAAMHDGAPIIYQATFFAAPWHGFTDFLRRVDTPSELGPHSYEVIDTKLARSASPKHVLQLALYSEMVGHDQGALPRNMHLVLGNGEEASFRRIEFHHTLRVAQSRYLKFIADDAAYSRAEPCSSCSLCGWRELCSAQWEADDHLSLVAGMQAPQIKKLREAGIHTVAELAALAPETRVPKLAPATLARLQAQAQLQVACRGSEPKGEALPIEAGRGFSRLPHPSPHDLFFDLEGDPLHPDGLEYLWGVHFRDPAGTTTFRFEWAHDRAAERAAFETMVDWFSEHLRRHPEAHIYHYAAYEVSVLRRLSTAFASREDAVDQLLRHEKFVDLYSVVRGAVRTSQPDLSLKTLETFFADKRAQEVTKADQSIVHYHRWRETGDESLLDGILAYNKVDCQNTEGLRDWLLSLRPDLPWWTKEALPAPAKAQEAEQREARLNALRQAVRADDVPLSPRVRELASHLLDYHTRAKKPEFWAIYDRCERELDELIDDGECIGGIEPAGADWQRPDKRSIVATYRFPPQDTKLREGKTVLHAPTRSRLGTIVTLDRGAGVVEVKRGKSEDPFPLSGSIIPTWPLDTGVLESAAERVIQAWSAARANGGATGPLLYRHWSTCSSVADHGSTAGKAVL